MKKVVKILFIILALCLIGYLIKEYAPRAWLGVTAIVHYIILHPFIIIGVIVIRLLYVLFNTVKNLKKFYYFNYHINFKIPKVLVYPLINIGFALGLWKGYFLYLNPLDYGSDSRSEVIGQLINNLVELSISKDGEDKAFGIKRED